MWFNQNVKVPFTLSKIALKTVLKFEHFARNNSVEKKKIENNTNNTFDKVIIPMNLRTITSLKLPMKYFQPNPFYFWSSFGFQQCGFQWRDQYLQQSDTLNFNDVIYCCFDKVIITMDNFDEVILVKTFDHNYGFWRSYFRQSDQSLLYVLHNNHFILLQTKQNIQNLFLWILETELRSTKPWSVLTKSAHRNINQN